MNINKSLKYYTILCQINLMLVCYLVLQSHVEPKNLVFLKTHNIKFEEIIATFTDQSVRPLE